MKNKSNLIISSLALLLVSVIVYSLPSPGPEAHRRFTIHSYMDPYQVWSSHIEAQGVQYGLAYENLFTNYLQLQDAGFTHAGIPLFFQHTPSYFAKLSTGGSAPLAYKYAVSGRKRISISSGGENSDDEHRQWSMFPVSFADVNNKWVLHAEGDNTNKYHYYPDGEHSDYGLEVFAPAPNQPYLLAKVNEHSASTDSTPFMQYTLHGGFNKFASRAYYFAGLRFAHGIDPEFEDGDKVLFSVKLGYVITNSAIRALNENILVLRDPLILLDSEFGGSNFHYSSHLSNLAMPDPPDEIQDVTLIRWSNPIEVTFDDVYNGTYRVNNDPVHVNDTLEAHYIGPFGSESFEGLKPFPAAFSLPMVIRIDWHGEADFYLQWVEMFDEYYYDLVILDDDSKREAIAQELIDNYNASPFKDRITMWGFDEPPYYCGKSMAIVDSIARLFTGIGLNGPLGGDNGQFETDHIGWLWNTKKVFVGDRIPGYPENMRSYSHRIKDNMIYDFYVLKPHFSYSTTFDTTSIQRAYDDLIKSYGNNGTGRNQGLWGANLISRIANIPWNHVVGVQSEWHRNGNTGVYDDHFFRDPTPEEVAVQAYLALSFGAKGLGFYNVTSIYDWARGHRNRNAANAPPISESDPSMAQVRGLFDFVDPDGAYFEDPQDLLNETIAKCQESKCNLKAEIKLTLYLHLD